MPQLLRILVADDHPLTAEGMRRVLAEIPAEVVVALTLDDARGHLDQSTYDVVLLDISFGNSGITGFDLLREAHRRSPTLRILIVSMFDDPELQEESRKEGARGFISKLAIGRDLVDATRVVLAGGNAFPGLTSQNGRTLSARQLQVSEELAQGLQEKEIASKLGVSVRMVETHLHAAKETLKARSLPELMAKFFQRGFQLLPKSWSKRKRSTD